jgi:hypothetical protein
VCPAHGQLIEVGFAVDQTERSESDRATCGIERDMSEPTFDAQTASPNAGRRHEINLVLAQSIHQRSDAFGYWGRA